MNINVKGVWLAMKYEILQMLKNEEVYSKYFLRSWSNYYTASKHAVLGLTKSTALECAKSGIKINAVSSGVIDTDLIGENRQFR